MDYLRVPTKPGPQSGAPYGPHYGPPSNGVNSFESSSVNIQNDFENIEHLDNTWFHALLRPTLPARLFQSAKTRHAQ